MNCRQVEAMLADWSADNLPVSSCEELQVHLRQCPPCAQEWKLFQEHLHLVSSTTQPCCSAERTRAMWRQCERHIEKKVKTQSLNRQVSAKAWWQLSPRFGFATLAGAFVILIAVSLTPASWLRGSSASNSGRPTSTVAAPREEWVRFTQPPLQASAFINHHTTMAFDPFADHVASTLISDAATNFSANDVNVIPVAETSTDVTARQKQ